jgi:hypothetical protein
MFVSFENEPNHESVMRMLDAVMSLGIDKWLEGDELKQNEATRAATAREKALKIIEKLQLENALLKERIKKMEELIKSVFPKCVTCGKVAHNYVEDYGAFCNYDCWCKANGAEESDPSDIETMEDWAEIEKLLEGKK